MTVEEWNLVINNASNIWMAGMMTIQVILLVWAGIIASRQYMSYLAIEKRNHLKSSVRLNREWNNLMEFTFSRTTINHSFNFEKDFPNLPDELRYIARGASIVTEKIWDKRQDSESINAQIFEELSFLQDNRLIDLYHSKKRQIELLEKKYRALYTDLHRLNDYYEGKIEGIYDKNKIIEEADKFPMFLKDTKNKWGQQFETTDQEFQSQLFFLMKKYV